MCFRQFRAEDAQLLFELDSDHEVMRFVSKVQPTLAQIQNEFIPRFLDYYSQSPPRGFWAAHLRDTSEFAGWFHLRPGKIFQEEMELGYRLKRSVWGRGLATEGSRNLIRKAFCEWGYEKVSAHTMASNFASRRVMEKAGLTFEREFHYDVDVLHGWIEEEERRAVKYSVTRAEFSLQLP
jgi:RimJ/RimL family protein N-acetyltransferase